MNLKNSRRPQSTISDPKIGTEMTMRKYAKHIKDQSISKAEIIKRGILTKSQLDKAIHDGDITAIQIGARQYINKTSVYEFLRR